MDCEYCCKPWAEGHACVGSDLAKLLAKRDAESVEGIEVDLTTYKVHVQGYRILMSPRTTRVLEAFVRRPERVYTFEELIELAYPDNYDATVLWVRATALKAIRKAIRGTKWRIQNVYGLGYRMERKA
jgi:DNA-binding response OmpR family regulator